MSSETRRILLGSIITGHNAEVIVTPPKKAGLLDLFRNPFASRKASRTAIDLNTIIDEVVVEQKLDQSAVIAPNAPEIEFRLLAQRIKGASEEDRLQIIKTVNIFYEVNEAAEKDGKSKMSVIDIPKAVKQGKVAEVVDVAAEHLPFDLMPGSQGLKKTDRGIMAYQVVQGNPLAQHQIGSKSSKENEAQLAVLLPKKEVSFVESAVEQQNMTAVIMLEEDELQITQPTETIEAHNFFAPTETPQLSDTNISYLSDYRKADNMNEDEDLDLAA